ncbi:MAG: hypothetical protein DRP93_04055 [Candidatus Neomarinimicrobiota bacterium]|nr:MAG: hypothetical protein DRP93_04055 [Candidatus Neomarinimicrobiota bacterium]
MNNKKFEPYYNPSKSGLLILFAIFLIAIGGVRAQEKKKKKRKKKPVYSASFTLGTTYDDNILKYSEKYLDRFMNGEDEGRFHIDTYDDVIFNTGISINSTFYIFKKRKSVINIGANRRTYAINKVKNWSYITIGIRQYLAHRISFKFSYSYIPEFYVRHFRDREWIQVYGFEPISFQPYAFSKDNYGFYIQKYFFKGTRIKFSLFYSPYYHNEHYTEYDSKNWSYITRIYQKVHKNITLDAEYQFITSDAKGYDASYQTPETTLGPDATYVEDRFSFGVSWKLPKIFKKTNSLNVKSSFQNRYYSSKYRPITDPLHAGRVDKNVRLYFDYRISFNKSLKLKAFYYRYMRDSSTEAELNKQYISDEKDYTQNLIGLEFIYTLK